LNVLRFVGYAISGMAGSCVFTWLKLGDWPPAIMLLIAAACGVAGGAFARSVLESTKAKKPARGVEDF
jgi:uncharacterized membrane protein YfcA